MVNELSSLQIPLGWDNPQRLDYDESLHAFAVVCIRREPGRVGEEDSPTSSLKLLDDKTFDRMSLSLTYPCPSQMTYEYTMTRTLPIHLSERRRNHDSSNDSIIRWRHGDMRWYSIPQIRGEGTESRPSTPFQCRVGHRALEQQASAKTNLRVGGQGLCPCARSRERVIGRGHRPLGKHPLHHSLCSAESRTVDRFPSTKSTARVSERSQTGTTTT